MTFVTCEAIWLSYCDKEKTHKKLKWYTNESKKPLPVLTQFLQCPLRKNQTSQYSKVSVSPSFRSVLHLHGFHDKWLRRKVLVRHLETVNTSSTKHNWCQIWTIFLKRLRVITSFDRSVFRSQYSRHHCVPVHKVGWCYSKYPSSYW